jgi:AcrR family transcriptional regulator
MVVTLGLRERKKLELRKRLSDLALELFAERGFENVTVAEIAAAANVSEKTVFNHFATKEDLLLGGREEVEARLLRAIQERAPGTSVLSVVRRHTLALADQMETVPARRRAAFRNVVQSTPAVHMRMLEISLRSEEALGAYLAAEQGTGPHDPTSRVVASTIGALTRLAFGIGWPPAKRRSHAEVRAGIDAAFDRLERGLANLGRNVDGE